jgi:DNA-binding CsgD family transcriptional regulator
MTMTTLLNDNLLVQRHTGGIKLMQPKIVETPPSGATRSSLSLADLFSMPFHIYVEDKHNIIVDINSSCALLYGYPSKYFIIGASLTEISSLDKRRFNNRQIIKSSSYGVFHEVIRLEHRNIDIISIKFRWLNDSDKVQGILVCDITLNLQNPASLADDINRVINLLDSTGEANPIWATCTDELKKHFTKREVEVIQWVVRGKTMREIANITGLSTRTVESYFETIKKKADVKTKSQFIEKAINYYNL